MRAPGNSGEIMSRLTVVRASRRLVQMWTENLLIQPFLWTVKREERSRSKRCAFVERLKVSKNPLNGKLTRPSEDREWLSKNFMKLRQKSMRVFRKEKFCFRFFRRSIRNLNLNDFSYIKQVDGQVWRIGIEKQALPRKSRKRLPRN